MRVVVKKERPLLPATTLPLFAQLIRRCWDAEPSQRPSAADVVTELESANPIAPDISSGIHFFCSCMT